MESGLLHSFPEKTLIFVKSTSSQISPLLAFTCQKKGEEIRCSFIFLRPKFKMVHLNMAPRKNRRLRTWKPSELQVNQPLKLGESKAKNPPPKKTDWSLLTPPPAAGLPCHDLHPQTEWGCDHHPATKATLCCTTHQLRPVPQIDAKMAKVRFFTVPQKYPEIEPKKQQPCQKN